ncbi:hypothetical protein ABPG72_009914 [Tetrahymena utriculariae]
MNQAENLVESVKIVDQNNQFVEYATRKVMREKGLCHQATYIILVNSQGQICTHLRHQDKLWCGGYWTTSFGGCVSEGEDYNTNAQKELSEEAGVDHNNQLLGLDTFLYSTDTQKVWGKVFLMFYEGEVKFQKEEIQEIKWRYANEVRQAEEQYTPDGNISLEILLNYAKENQNKHEELKLLLKNA